MKIAVVGSINIDIVASAPHIPKKGETIMGTDLNFIPGGKGANQAVALGQLGADVTMFACIGDDDFGRLALANLQERSVNTSVIKIIPNQVTGVALITVGDNDNSIVVVPGANDKVDISYIDSIKQELLQSDIVVLQLEIPLKTVEYVVKLCKEAHITVLLNPAPAQVLPESLIEAVDFLTPNEHESAILFNETGEYFNLLRQYPEKLIITLGSAGVCTALKSGEILTVSALPATVVDTTGAGDTFNGAFAYAIASQMMIHDALTFANAAASLSIEKFGAQGGMPTLEQVLFSLEKNHLQVKLP